MSNHFFHVMIWRHPNWNNLFFLWLSCSVPGGVIWSKVVIWETEPKSTVHRGRHQRTRCDIPIVPLKKKKKLYQKGKLCPKRGWKKLLRKLVVWLSLMLLSLSSNVVQKVVVHSLYIASSATASTWLLLTQLEVDNLTGTGKIWHKNSGLSRFLGRSR